MESGIVASMATSSTNSTKNKSSKSKATAKTTKTSKAAADVAKKESVKAVEPAPVQAEKKAEKPKAKNKKITFAKLRKWNLWLGALHAVQAIVILVLSTTSTLPVSTNYLAVDELSSKARGGEMPVLAPATQQIFDVNLAYLVAGFFALSAIAHLVIATVYRKRYEADLEVGVNKARWIEYALSASTMIVAIGLLVGIYDLSTLVAIFALTAVMNLLGLVMEVHNKGAEKPNWLSYIIGCIAGAVPWVIISIYLIGGAVYGDKAPAFVYWIFVSIFLFFMSFALNMYLQYKRVGKWANYLYGERAYMILSLVAKSALAWQVFAGTLRP